MISKHLRLETILLSIVVNGDLVSFSVFASMLPASTVDCLPFVRHSLRHFDRSSSDHYCSTYSLQSNDSMKMRLRMIVWLIEFALDQRKDVEVLVRRSNVRMGHSATVFELDREISDRGEGAGRRKNEGHTR